MPKRKITVKEFHDWVVDMVAMAMVEGRKAKDEKD